MTSLALIISLTFCASAKIVHPQVTAEEKFVDEGCTVDNAPELLLQGEKLIIGGSDQYQPCDKRNMGYRLRKALMNLGRMIGMDGRHRWGDSIIGPNPFKFFVDRVSYIHPDDHGNRLCDPFTGAYYMKRDRDGDTRGSVQICAQSEKLSDLNLMGLLLHEARHHDGKEHVHCEFGAATMLSRYSCDPSLEDKNAYGVSLEFSLAAMKELTLTPAQRQEARSNAISLLLTSFNKLPRDLTFTAAMFPVKGGMYVLQGNRDRRILDKLPPGFLLGYRTGNPLLINPATAQQVEYAFRPNEIDVQPEPFLKGPLAADRARFIQQVQLGDMYCYVFTSKVTCYQVNSAENQTINFRNQTIKRVMIVSEGFEKNTDSQKPVPYIWTSTGVTTFPKTFAELKKNDPYVQADEDVAKVIKHDTDIVTFPKSHVGPYRHLLIYHLARGGPLRFINPDFTSGLVPNLTVGPLRRLTGPMVWSEVIERL